MSSSGSKVPALPVRSYCVQTEAVASADSAMLSATNQPCKCRDAGVRGQDVLKYRCVIFLYEFVAAKAPAQRSWAAFLKHFEIVRVNPARVEWRYAIVRGLVFVCETLREEKWRNALYLLDSYRKRWCSTRVIRCRGFRMRGIFAWNSTRIAARLGRISSRRRRACGY
jgi:hypothetical protein